MPNQIITQEGYNKLKEELEHSTAVKRRKIANRIEKAKELGDLSENAEYHEAKDAQAFNEGRIIEINNILKNVEVVEEGEKNNGTIRMGSTIIAVNKATNNEKEFKIVSFNEADPLEGKISNESPMGMAFIDKKKGQEVTVETPRGEVKYKILKVK